MSIFWGGNNVIQQIQRSETGTLSKPTRGSRQTTASRGSSGKRRPRSRQQTTKKMTKSFSSTTPIGEPDTNLTGVLHTLISMIRKQLAEPPQRPLFVPPKHLGYADGTLDSEGSEKTKYYPLSVGEEDTNQYFLNLEHSEKEKLDRDGRNSVLKKVATASVDNQRYPFDRSAGNYIQNALEEEEEKRKEEQRKVEQVSISQEQITALRSEGLWIKQQDQNMNQRLQRLEHLLSLVQSEQKNEISREKRLLECSRKSSAQMERVMDEKIQGKSKDLGNADMGAVREHRQIVAEIQTERVDTADRIMRILQDYDLISGAQMATYLLKALENVKNAPVHATNTFESSLSGITNPDNVHGGESRGSQLSSAGTDGGKSKTLLSLKRNTKGQVVPAGGLGSDLMRTPRGRYLPIATTESGMVTHMGFGKSGRTAGGTKSSTRSSTRSSTSHISSVNPEDNTTRVTTADESAIMTNTKRSELPSGAMSRRGRALMYRNYRSLLVEEQGATTASSSSTTVNASASTPLLLYGGQRSVTRPSTDGVSSSSSSSSNRKWSPPPTRGLRDLAPNWYPHMGTMPAPVGVAERALRNPRDPSAGKRDGRGLPPEEVLPDDDQPFEGRVRWFAKKNDLNFYPMLTAPSFSRSFAADQIIRKMLEENKKSNTMTGMPAYRLSMPMAGAKTYGESANSFSFLLGRPLQPLQ